MIIKGKNWNVLMGKIFLFLSYIAFTYIFYVFLMAVDETVNKIFYPNQLNICEITNWRQIFELTKFQLLLMFLLLFNVILMLIFLNMNDELEYEY